MAKPQVAASNSLVLDTYARVSRVGDERQRSTGGQVDDGTVRVQDLNAAVGDVYVDDGRSAWDFLPSRLWDGQRVGPLQDRIAGCLRCALGRNPSIALFS